jgi:hypothetical protein
MQMWSNNKINRLILSYGSSVTDIILYTEMVKMVQVLPSVVRCMTADITRYHILGKGTCYFRLYKIQ